NLSGVDLTLLPLARLRGGLTLEEREHSTRSQRRMAAIRLEKALLSSTHLEGACLSRGHLEEVEATNAHLEQADLHVTYLEHANFQQAHLDGADLRRAFFDSASSLEDLSLGNSEYGGASLANVRWNGVNLTEVQWAYSVQAFGKRQFKTFILGDERRARQKKSHKGAIKTSARRLHEYRASVRANRQLAVELRNQGLAEEADHFAYRAQLLQRIVFRYEHQPLKYLFSWFLGLLTGYGYRMWRIIIAYVLLNLAFATTYWSLGVQQPHDISFWTALIVSVTAFHGRVFSSPFTPNIADAQIIVTGIEAVAGLVIESLFVAMLVQKFFSR
ncbi:MAG TPA: pentapeptide repeat-containing protein, partial [Ktedonobacteraceae bacterium]|nr:pentapeptide repeat-containing protein [Ktedonobacteraceae bacterium]